MSNLSIKRLTERAASLDASRKRASQAAKSQKLQLIGAASALGGAGVAGFADGSLDVTKFDDQAGDGLRVAGLPAMGVVSAGLVAGGMYMGGTVGHALMNAGLGVGCGLVYNKMRVQGVEAAAEAGEK